MVFIEICINLNKILGKYDNILLEVNLIDELKPSSDKSNHLLVAKNDLNLTNVVVKKPTCLRLQD